MEKILITTKNFNDSQLLLKLLKKLDFVNSVEHLKDGAIPKSKFKSWEDFNEGFGIGKNNKITLKEIRERAWPKRK